MTLQRIARGLECKEITKDRERNIKKGEGDSHKAIDKGKFFDRL